METAADGLNEATRRFNLWRRRSRGVGRIPNELWQLAAEVAQAHGVEETARRLQVDQRRLKQRIQERGPARPLPRTPSFVELPPLPVGSAPECTFELESPSGRKLRISLKGAATAQAVEIGHLLCREGP